MLTNHIGNWAIAMALCAIVNSAHADEFEYDALGRLVSVTHAGGGSTGGDLVTSYEYDAAGNRTEKAISNTGGGSNSAPSSSVLVGSVSLNKGGSALLKDVFTASDPDGDPMAYELTSTNPEAGSHFKRNGVNLGQGPVVVSHADFQLLRWQLADEWDIADDLSFKATDGSAWSATVSMDIEGESEPEDEEEEEPE